MLEAALNSKVAFHTAYFEIFARKLPPGRNYGVVCGTLRLPELIEAFRFDDNILKYLKDKKIVNKETQDYLANFTFSGNLYSYLDGELYFPNSPILRVEAPFGEALLLETLLLSVLNFDSAVASAASRMVQVSSGRALIEMGGRRTHEIAATSAARAAYICGFSSTSNLRAGQLYDIPTAGTSGHALILAHEDEYTAFSAQLKSQGTNTTALVDTYDISKGIVEAIEVFGPHLRSIRIDSGDLDEGSRSARKLLDNLGATKTSITVSGDLDEYLIEKLKASPIDGFGVGTKLVGGSGYPTANFVYKLVAIKNNGAIRPVTKLSSNKENAANPKSALRTLTTEGKAIEELTYFPVELGQSAPVLGNYRTLQHQIIERGLPSITCSIHDLRNHYKQAISELDQVQRQKLVGSPDIIVRHLPR